MNVNRREAIQRVAILMGGMISAPAMAGIQGQKSHPTFVQFSASQESLVAEIADIIIPTQIRQAQKPPALRNLSYALSKIVTQKQAKKYLLLV